MNKSLIVELQDRIVISLANSVVQNWDFLLLNIEIDIVDGELDSNCLAVSFTKEDQNWKRQSANLRPEGYLECSDLFHSLRETMAETDSQKWTSCTLELAANGKYQYSFSYEPPRRLNGIHDSMAMFTNYTPRIL